MGDAGPSRDPLPVAVVDFVAAIPGAWPPYFPLGWVIGSKPEPSLPAFQLHNSYLSNKHYHTNPQSSITLHICTVTKNQSISIQPLLLRPWSVPVELFIEPDEVSLGVGEEV